MHDKDLFNKKDNHAEVRRKKKKKRQPRGNRKQRETSTNEKQKEEIEVWKGSVRFVKEKLSVLSFFLRVSRNNKNAFI